MQVWVFETKMTSKNKRPPEGCQHYSHLCEMPWDIQKSLFRIEISTTASLIDRADTTTNALAYSQNTTRAYGWQKMLGLAWPQSLLRGNMPRYSRLQRVDTVSAPLRAILPEPPLQKRPYWSIASQALVAMPLHSPNLRDGKVSMPSRKTQECWHVRSTTPRSMASGTRYLGMKGIVLKF